MLTYSICSLLVNYYQRLDGNILWKLKPRFKKKKNAANSMSIILANNKPS